MTIFRFIWWLSSRTSTIRLHDNLVDVLLISVKTFENAALREHRDWCFDERKQHEQAAESLLDDLDASVFQVLRQIREAVADELLSDKEKVARIGLLGAAGANGGRKIQRTPRLPGEWRSR